MPSGTFSFQPRPSPRRLQPGVSPSAGGYSAEIDAALHEPTLAARLADLGGGPLLLPGGRTTSVAFDAFIRAEIAKWAEVVRRTGAKPE